MICVLYRPPDCPALSFRSCLDFLDQYIAEERDEYQLSILGDFNLPLIFFFFFFLGAAPTDCTQDLTPGQQLSNGECSTGVQLAT